MRQQMFQGGDGEEDAQDQAATPPDLCPILRNRLTDRFTGWANPDRRESDTELIAILVKEDEEWFTERLSYAFGGAAALAAARAELAAALVPQPVRSRSSPL